MSGLSEEEFNEILRTKVDLGKYTDVCINHYHDGQFDKFDPFTGEKINIPDDVKHLFSVLKLAAQTELGKELLTELDSNVKVTFIVDKTLKGEAYGYSNASHLIALTDPERNIAANATTILHELTHEVQKQQGGNSRFLPTEEDRFMTNKMMEAEARLNTAKAASQILPLLENEEALREFLHSSSEQTLYDCQMYRQLKSSGASEEEINKQMLQNFYQDKEWNEGYNEQAIGAAKSYQTSQNAYIAGHTQDSKQVQIQYMRRLGLDNEDAKYFFDPNYISDYPHDRIKAKSESSMTYDDGVVRKNVLEDNEVVYSAEFNSDRLLSEQRTVNGVKVEKHYDAEGQLVLLNRTYKDPQGCEHKVFEKEGQDSYEIIKDNKGKIVKIATLDGADYADAQKIEQQMSVASEVFNKIKSNEAVSNEDLMSAYNFIEQDQLGVCDGMHALKKTITDKAQEYQKNQSTEDAKGEYPKDLSETIPLTKDPQMPSEEIILDEMLRAGKLTREQEDKILEMAVFIEQKRLKEKELGISDEKSYAEQFIDKIKDSKDFSESQKDVALNAAIKAENIEKKNDYDKLRALRGILHSTPSQKTTTSESFELSPVLQANIEGGRE